MGLESPDPGPWAYLQEYVLLSEKGRVVDTGPVVRREYCSSFRGIVEEGEQNKLDSYPSQMMAAKKISVNGDMRLTVSANGLIQWALGG